MDAELQDGIVHRPSSSGAARMTHDEAQDAGIAFGRWLREQRRARDLTQDAFGGQIGCVGETIRKIEAGVSRPSRQVAELMAAYLGVPAPAWPRFVQWARLLPVVAARSWQPGDPPAALPPPTP